MAAGPITQISDVVVPAIFTPYTQQLTEEKARLIQAGAVVRDSEIDRLLAGGGLTFDVPSFKDLDSDQERVSTDSIPYQFTGGVANPDPDKTGTGTEIAVRLSRNNSWASADLAAVLAGKDPMASIADRIAYYWTRRMQAALVAVTKGLFLANDAATAADHVQFDMTHDISTLNGGVFSAGVTDFSAEAFLDAALTMGDSQDGLKMVMVHSVVYNKMQKNNLIDFIPDARGEIMIPTFLGREVIVDDGVPFAGGVYQTWLFGPGAIRLGVGAPKIPTEIDRIAGAGNGGGAEVLYNRVEWALHPVGNAYAGTAPKGGPSNAATTNNLAAAASWTRVFPERKQIKIARLVTREA
jgi:hypothetical protein